MTMSVLNLQNGAMDDSYFSSGFRNLIENHLQILKNTSKTKGIEVEHNNQVKFRGDFYGLLNELNVKSEFHWITLRLNSLSSPMDYDGSFYNILIPDKERIEFLLKRWLNSQGYV